MSIGPYQLGPNNTAENGIYTGDARDLARAIPDESVDLIFTDPVYQNIDDYRWLTEMGARVLVDGGSCIAQIGPEYMPEVLAAMTPALDWVWELMEWYGSGAGKIWYKRIFLAHKPWLWFSKGPRAGKWVRTGGQSVRDKNHHRWGDSAGFMLPYIRALCPQDGVTLDPFTGGGTVPAACKMLNRCYLAFEIEPDTADDARQRIRETQPPLPLEIPTQGKPLNECLR